MPRSLALSLKIDRATIEATEQGVVVDSTCTHHITINKFRLKCVRELSTSGTDPDGGHAKIRVKGEVDFLAKDVRGCNKLLF